MSVPRARSAPGRELANQSRLDAILANDQWQARRALASSIFDRHALAHLSDLEVACAYQSGDANEHDALYCELHLRRLTPWKIVEGPVPMEVQS